MTTIPVWIKWLRYLTFTYYSYNLLLKIEYAGRTLYDCHGSNPSHPASTPGCVPVPQEGVSAALRLWESVDVWPYEAVVLIGWLVVFRVLVYYALRHKTNTM